MSSLKLEELLKKGTELISLEKYNEAEDIFKEMIQIDSNISSPLVNLGMIYLIRERVSEAINVLNKAISIDSRSIEAYQNLGSCYLSMQDFDEAEKAYLKALQIDPNNFNTYHNLSLVYIKSQQWSKAKKPLEKILQIDEINYQASFHLGFIYLTAKEYYPAIANFLYTINLKNDYHTARVGLADALYKIGRYKAAIRELEIVITNLPDFVTPYVKSALIYIETDNKEKAIPLLEKALQINDNNIDVIEILSVLYEEKGEIDKSEELYQKIIIKDPENRSATEGLERIKTLGEKIKLSVS